MPFVSARCSSYGDSGPSVSVAHAWGTQHNRPALQAETVLLMSGIRCGYSVALGTSSFSRRA